MKSVYKEGRINGYRSPSARDRTHSPFVFPGLNGNQRTEVRKSWLRIKKRAKLPNDFRFHGLRHTFGTLAAASRVDPFALKNLLAHRKLSTTERYTHLVQHKIAQAPELVEDVFNDSSVKVFYRADHPRAGHVLSNPAPHSPSRKIRLYL